MPIGGQTVLHIGVLALQMHTPPRLTLEQLQVLACRTPAARLAAVVEPLNKTLKKCSATTRMRLSYFVAYLLHESGEFSAHREDMNYPSSHILDLWGSAYFPDFTANDYHCQPEKLANYIYSDAMCPPKYRLGNDQPGDGWKYRAWGPKKICGKAATQAYLRKMGLPLDTDPDDLLKPQFLCESAGQFWTTHRLNDYADADDIVGCAVILNAGRTDFESLKRYLDLALATLPDDGGICPVPEHTAALHDSATGDRRQGRGERWVFRIPRALQGFLSFLSGLKRAILHAIDKGPSLPGQPGVRR